jgi:ribose-phosphate pyrophosphokinase
MTEVLRVVAGSANPGLGAAVANHLGIESDGCRLARFPDGELRPAIENICGADVYVIQPTVPPVNEHIIELLLLLDACRRSRAARVTAVVPYFGYARQDRRTAAGQALGSTVIADAIAAGADRLVVIDPHTPALEAQCRIPVETLTAVPTLTARDRARQQIEALPPQLRSLNDAGPSYPVAVSPGVASELERLRHAQQIADEPCRAAEVTQTSRALADS